MRRKFLVGFLGIAGLCAGSIAAIYAFTRGASGDVSPPAAAEVAVEPVAAPAAAVARAAPPRPEVAQSAAAAPESASVPRAKLAKPPIPKPRPAATPISVSFKMDPRLTSGVHIGTRWVSPPTYVGVQAGNLFRVPARVGSGSGASGREPTWLPARPDMVTVTPERGSEVEISVLREGRSTIMVASADASATLTVNAVREAGLWRVDISQ